MSSSRKAFATTIWGNICITFSSFTHNMPIVILHPNNYFMRAVLLLLVIHVFIFVSCKKELVSLPINEDPASFFETGSIDIGDAGAAEISTYDPQTKRLFVVNNSTTNKIDVIDFANPSKPVLLTSISVTSYGGFVNCLDVYDGKLAAAIEAVNKQDAGKVVVFKTNDYSEVKVIPVGALPDMITYSPDGKYILTANEGEPNMDYSNDPLGTVSIISVTDNYAVVNLDFSSFASSQTTLQAGGLRVFGIGNNFAKDLEPEYVTISPDSKTVWVTLQENNAIAKINIETKTVTQIFPLGFKNYNLDTYKMDLSDRDNVISFNNKWNVKGMFQPDAVVMIPSDVPLLFTANEGDAREYTALAEVKRIKDITLDPVVFPNAAALKADAQLGRLNITTTLGNPDGDNDYDELYSFGARSFSMWNGNTGALVYDSKNELDQRVATDNLYDDARSDDKGSEPEGLAIGKMGNRTVLFVGLERADAVAMYDITYPYYPIFMKILKTGDAPEGVLFISADKSPTGRSLLVVSCENDGVVKVYTTK